MPQSARSGNRPTLQGSTGACVVLAPVAGSSSLLTTRTWPSPSRCRRCAVVRPCSSRLADVTRVLPAAQVLQTLSILIQNIRSETAIFYLFSNNFINELITLRFDFDDDEVLGYFVNMLKAISLKLTQTTVQVRPSLTIHVTIHRSDHLSDTAARCRPRREGIELHLRATSVLVGVSSTADHTHRAFSSLTLHGRSAFASCARSRAACSLCSSSFRSSRSSSPSRCTRRPPSSSDTGTAWCAAAPRPVAVRSIQLQI